MRDKETGLTTRQLAFSKYYAREPNAGKAYLAAGYKSSKHAHIHGYKLLQNNKILAVIKREKEKTAIKCELSRAEMITHIKYGLEESERRNNLSALARFTELGCRTVGMLKDNVNVTDVVAQQQLEKAEAAEVVEIGKVRVNQFINANDTTTTSNKEGMQYRNQKSGKVETHRFLG